MFRCLKKKLFSIITTHWEFLDTKRGAGNIVAKLSLDFEHWLRFPSCFDSNLQGQAFFSGL